MPNGFVVVTGGDGCWAGREHTSTSPCRRGEPWWMCKLGIGRECKCASSWVEVVVETRGSRARCLRKRAAQLNYRESYHADADRSRDRSICLAQSQRRRNATRQPGSSCARALTSLRCSLGATTAIPLAQISGPILAIYNPRLREIFCCVFMR